MTKRVIYILLSFIIMSMIPYMTFISDHNIMNINPLIDIISYSLIVSTLTLIISRLNSIVRKRISNDHDDLIPLPFTVGILTLWFKRIKVNDIGYYWMRIEDGNIIVYEQRYLFMVERFKGEYNSESRKNIEKILKFKRNGEV